MRPIPARDFDDDDIWSGSKQRNWLVVGLVVSLLLHSALCVYFYRTRFEPLSAAFKAPEKTATFKVKNVDLQPLDKASADQAAQAAKPEPDKTDMRGIYTIQHWDQCAPGTRLEFALHEGGHSIPKGWAKMAMDWFEDR